MALTALINNVKKHLFFPHKSPLPPESILFIDFRTLLHPLIPFSLLVYQVKVFILAGLRQGVDKWAEVWGMGTGPEHENEELMRSGRGWLTGSLRVDIMRIRGAGMVDEAGAGEKWGKEDGYMRGKAWWQSDRNWGYSHKRENEGSWGRLEKEEEERGRLIKGGTGWKYVFAELVTEMKPKILSLLAQARI